MELKEAKQKFIQAWGSFGGEWGISKTMAQIHGLLMVSEKSMNTDEIMEELKISRGNANMNLRMLIEWGVVYKDSYPGERKDYYIAEKDIWLVARRIAAHRRRKELDPVVRVLSEVRKVDTKKDDGSREFKAMVEQIMEMASFADVMLRRFEESEKNWMLKTMMKVLK